MRGQVILRHTKLTAYRCFLPDLAGFTGFGCTGPGPLTFGAIDVGLHSSRQWRASPTDWPWHSITMKRCRAARHDHKSLRLFLYRPSELVWRWIQSTANSALAGIPWNSEKYREHSVYHLLISARDRKIPHSARLSICSLHSHNGRNRELTGNLLHPHAL